MEFVLKSYDELSRDELLRKIMDKPRKTADNVCTVWHYITIDEPPRTVGGLKKRKGELI